MKAIKRNYKDFFTRITCFIFWLVVCPALSGQTVPKKNLLASDYKLWSFMVPDQISDNGNWTSYRLMYQYTSTDTLIVQHTSDYSKKIVLPNALKGKFNGETDFGCIARGTFTLVNLNSQKIFEKKGVEDFEFSADQKHVIIVMKNADGKLSLEIRDTDEKLLFERSNINRYRFDPKSNGIAYSTTDTNSFKVEAVLFGNSISKFQLAENTAFPYQNIIWKGDKIVFLENCKESPVLFSYDLRRKQIQCLNSDFKQNSTGMTISNSELANPILSSDGLRIFFWLKEPNDKERKINENEVEVWNSKDKLLFDFHKYAPYYTWSDKLAVWNLKNNSVFKITDNIFPKAYLSPTYDYAFIFNPATYEPHSMKLSPYDLFALDLKSGQRSLIFKNHYPGKSLSVSPDGLYLSYAKEGQWWIYNIKKNNSICITSGFSSIFYSEKNDIPKDENYYGMAGWSKNNEVILYDQYDVWLVSVDGKTKKRLTNGRETQKTYRIKLFNTEPVIGNTEFIKYYVDPNEGFLMTTENKETRESGLSSWNGKSEIKELVWADKKISLTSKAKYKDVYMYLDQNFTCPPRLMLYNGISKEIVQTNKQQYLYNWGRNEPIEYMVNNTKTSGVLFYPANYQKGTKYPMVVYIYERLFSKLNEYQNPSLLSPDGFNTTSFTLQDYFVLYPDIVYESGNLSSSVTKSVLAAVDTVLLKGDVKQDKIGLTGHSFGGYETDLIITQTDRFAAAVAGAAVTDLVSSYLYAGPLFRRPDFWRMENHQFRIGKSLFEDMTSYFNNSPVLLAQNINTPLLAWTGKEDRHVNSLQSMELYLALRRLNKEHTLLIYPNEDHQIDNQKNAIDLSTRIMEWFAYYLKDGPQQDWMISNFKK